MSFRAAFFMGLRIGIGTGIILSAAFFSAARSDPTPIRQAAITADLLLVRNLGFDRVRLITYTKANDPAYTMWPNGMFLTFPQPTQGEIDNLKWFFREVAALGMTHEIVLLMPDSHGKYYNWGVTSDDYLAFIDALLPAVTSGRIARLYLGGDIDMSVISHQRWIRDLWPYVSARCPGCPLGIELLCWGAALWDRCADSTRWIRDHLTPLPGFLGMQLYPTRAVVNGMSWDTLVQSWLYGVREAAGSIKIVADEIGLMVGGEFTEQDQADFLAAALKRLGSSGVDANVWEFGDHPGIGRWGLMTDCRVPRKAVTALAALDRGQTSRGIQFNPPEGDGLSWLMPNGQLSAPRCP